MLKITTTLVKIFIIHGFVAATRNPTRPIWGSKWLDGGAVVTWGGNFLLAGAPPFAHIHFVGDVSGCIAGVDEFGFPFIISYFVGPTLNLRRRRTGSRRCGRRSVSVRRGRV